MEKKLRSDLRQLALFTLLKKLELTKDNSQRIAIIRKMNEVSKIKIEPAPWNKKRTLLQINPEMVKKYKDKLFSGEDPLNVVLNCVKEFVENKYLLIDLPIIGESPVGFTHNFKKELLDNCFYRHSSRKNDFVVGDRVITAIGELKNIATNGSQTQWQSGQHEDRHTNWLFCYIEKQLLDSYKNSFTARLVISYPPIFGQQWLYSLVTDKVSEEIENRQEIVEKNLEPSIRLEVY